MLLSFKESPGDNLESNTISVVKQPHFVSFNSKTYCWHYVLKCDTNPCTSRWHILYTTWKSRKREGYAQSRRHLVAACPSLLVVYLCVSLSLCLGKYLYNYFIACTFYLQTDVQQSFITRSLTRFHFVIICVHSSGECTYDTLCQKRLHKCKQKVLHLPCAWW